MLPWEAWLELIIIVLTMKYSLKLGVTILETQLKRYNCKNITSTTKDHNFLLKFVILTMPLFLKWSFPKPNLKKDSLEDFWKTVPMSKLKHNICKWPFQSATLKHGSFSLTVYLLQSGHFIKTFILIPQKIRKHMK